MVILPLKPSFLSNFSQFTQTVVKIDTMQCSMILRKTLIFVVEITQLALWVVLFLFKKKKENLAIMLLAKLNEWAVNQTSNGSHRHQ